MLWNIKEQQATAVKSSTTNRWSVDRSIGRQQSVIIGQKRKTLSSVFIKQHNFPILVYRRMCRSYVRSFCILYVIVLLQQQENEIQSLQLPYLYIYIYYILHLIIITLILLKQKETTTTNQQQNFLQLILIIKYLIFLSSLVCFKS